MLQQLPRYALTLVTSISCLASPQESSLLWRIESPQGAVSHVFGTIHLQDSLVFHQRDTVLHILRSSETFIAEIYLDSMQQVMRPELMMLPKGRTIADLYTAEELAEIRAALSERLGPMAVIAERMKPAAIAALLMLEDMDGQSSFGTVDQFLWNEAKKAKMTMVGIEAVEEQLGVLDAMPPRLLLEVVRDTSNDHREIDALREAYGREDLEQIGELIDSVSAVEVFMQQLNDDRNLIMAERLVDHLDRGGAFIAIGTAHLPGEQGLLNLLRMQGYRVAAVRGGRRSMWAE
jgi:uncharacterized protein